MIREEEVDFLQGQVGRFWVEEIDDLRRLALALFNVETRCRGEGFIPGQTPR